MRLLAISLFAFAACATPKAGGDASSATAQAAAKPAGCAGCSKGKEGGNAWCESCGAGYVNGVKTKCKACYLGKTSDKPVWCEGCKKGYIAGKATPCKACFEHNANSGPACSEHAKAE